MNNRIILLAICALVFPLRALCMDVDHMSARDIQERLREYEQTIHGHENNIREGKNAWHSNWDAAALILPSYSFIIPVLAKLWMFKLSHLPRFQNDPVVKYFQNIKWAKYLSVTALTSSIIYGAIRAIQHSSLGKYLSPNYQRMAQAKQALNGQEHIRNRFYQQINERYQNERDGVERERNQQTTAREASQRQQQAAQNDIARLRQDLGAAQVETRAMRARANRLQGVVDGIQHDHPELVPQEQHEQCAICLGDIEDPIRLDCGHSYCRACLREQFNTDMHDQNTVHLHCTAPNCNHAFTPDEIRAILGDDPQRDQLFNTYLDIAARVTGIAGIPNENRVQCPGTNCPSIFNWDGDRNHPQPIHCDACNTVFCANCRMLWGDHTDAQAGVLTCDVVARNVHLAHDAATPAQAQRAEAEDQQYIAEHTVPCPFCHMRVEHGEGCNHMICGGNAHTHEFYPGVGCHREFCWLCLAEWRGHCPNGCLLFGGVPRWQHANAPAH